MLTLYYKPTCPYSARVLAKAEELGISFDLKNIASDELLRDELIEKGGKKQVPYLVDADRNVALYESGDIIDYLNTHYSTTGTAPSATTGLRIHKNDDACDVCE